ncbi:MAG: DNA recombination protein RmuC [Bacteroidota bacterium]
MVEVGSSGVLFITVGILVGAVLGVLVMLLIHFKKMHLQRESLLTTSNDLSALTRTHAQLLSDFKQLQDKYLSADSALQSLAIDKEVLEKEKVLLLAQYEERKEILGKVENQMKVEFEALARRSLDQNSIQLSHLHKNSLADILNPLKERITGFEQKVAATYEQEARERLLLKKEIHDLVDLNLQLSTEAQNLTKALKGDNKVQGNWGEMVLAKILESSGLREGHEYTAQARDMALRSAEGKRLQPDIIVNLPEGKHLIIDAKVSLTAYERWVEEEDPARGTSLMKQHLDSIHTHIKSLSEKHYQHLDGVNSPDFVLMFMPVEPAFSVAVQAKPDLFSQAWERKIVLVSPTTLLATLKTVASIWKLELQNRNAQEIARQGGLLYDKFVGFVEELQRVGKYLDAANSSYEDAYKKLKDGKGALIPKAEKLRELGAQTRKRLSP